MRALPTATTGSAGTVDPLESLHRLTEEVGRTDLACDAWEVLVLRAEEVTRALVAAGLLPAHLVAGPGEPPVVVARLLLAAERHAADAVRRRHAPALCA